MIDLIFDVLNTAILAFVLYQWYRATEKVELLEKKQGTIEADLGKVASDQGANLQSVAELTAAVDTALAEVEQVVADNATRTGEAVKELLIRIESLETPFGSKR